MIPPGILRYRSTIEDTMFQVVKTVAFSGDKQCNALRVLVFMGYSSMGMVPFSDQARHLSVFYLD